MKVFWLLNLSLLKRNWPYEFRHALIYALYNPIEMLLILRLFFQFMRERERENKTKNQILKLQQQQQQQQWQVWKITANTNQKPNKFTFVEFNFYKLLCFCFATMKLLFLKGPLACFAGSLLYTHTHTHKIVLILMFIVETIIIKFEIFKRQAKAFVFFNFQRTLLIAQWLIIHFSLVF